MTSARSRFIRAAALAAAAAVLAACGGGSTDTTATSQEQAAADSSFPRTITHDKGSTEIPDKPQRIVALDNSLVEAVVLLERPLVGGISSYRDLKGFPPYLGDAVKDTKEVGPLETPDLEAVAALEPDLIVSATVRHDALYDELTKIAPTVFVKTTGPQWRENVTFLGEVLGEEDKAEEELSEYKDHAKQVGDAVNAKAGNPTISVVRFLADRPASCRSSRSSDTSSPTRASRDRRARTPTTSPPRSARKASGRPTATTSSSPASPAESRPRSGSCATRCGVSSPPSRPARSPTSATRSG
jgi:ABC-type Fe3+-hydroxamate transport system substrate-binding protein